QKERDVALRLLPIGLHGGELIVADKGYAGKHFETAVTERFGALILRPARKDEPDTGPHLAPIRQCIESIFWTLKDRLGLERHNARTLHGLRARITRQLLAIAAHERQRRIFELAGARFRRVAPDHLAGGCAARGGAELLDRPRMRAVGDDQLAGGE